MSDREQKAADTIGESGAAATRQPPTANRQPAGPSRRDFLKAAGFTLAGVTAACHRAPVDKAIPYLEASEQIVPGRAYWMASTCHACPARCGVLVKCRDGRPIKMEGNPDHPLSRGGLCAIGQASVLGLYDSQRLAAPLLQGKPAQWSAVDTFVASRLASAKRVRVVSSTLSSPAASRTIAEFLGRFEDGRHVVYDVPSCSAIADAHEATHGARAIPHYAFDKADVIVSIDADFLGTWISPVEFTKAYVRRAPDAWHAHYEARMSLTGAKADRRARIHPDEITALLAGIAATSSVHGRTLPQARTLVVCGSNDLEHQRLVNTINAQLGSYGATILLDQPSYQREGDDRALAALIEELPTVDALFIVDCNPVYDLPSFPVDGVPLVVTTATHVDETAKLAHVVAPDHHFLESWRDSEPVAGVYAVTQPAIAPLKNTRSYLESLAAWSGKPAKAYDTIRSAYTGHWDKAVHDGYSAHGLTERRRSAGWNVASPADVTPRRLPASGPAGRPPALRSVSDSLAVVLYPSSTMYDGRHAHNPWLHELPDPVTKLTWDNVASFSPATAGKLGITDGDVVKIHNVEIPAFIQPGQHDGIVALALGYGRIGTDRFTKVGPEWLLGRAHLTPGATVGTRVAHLANAGPVRIVKTGRRHELARTQLHDSMEGRDLGHEHAHDEDHAPKSLWPAKPRGPHRWAMAIDLDRCTGCSGCVIACQAENNVPVVGKDEVLRQREMHWMRIDRYYEGDGDSLSVTMQPMLCHHCGNAPCETVCPVLATVHSSDGLNQQVYNRCVGTRYCANNCPYKTRRFNWFDYPHNDPFANLVLNPDVAVRSRGVMEKCSMCVQRIEEARIQARQRGVPIADGAIQLACQQSCPADAIVFGDLQDPRSRVSAARKDPRHFRLLEELGVDPGVGYLRALRGDEEEKHV